MNTETPLLEIKGLKKYFPVMDGLGGRKDVVLRSVDDVSFTIYRGEVLGLVGESGCGKSTVGRLSLRLSEPTAGQIVFDGSDLAGLSRGELRGARRRMQMIFQDPYSSLNPFMRIGEMIGEVLVIHKIGGSRDAREKRVKELLQLVGLPVSFSERFPHELSGGQRQRASIARALAVEPEFIVADEAVSALDVSNQAQIINVLVDLKRKLGLTLLFISHNLAVVQDIADRVAVIYLGRMMEIAPTEELFSAPRHPYTRALLSSIPIPAVGVKRERIALTGDIPSPINPPSGCVFRTRCPLAFDRCASEVPAFRTVASGHNVACHLA
jgi:oligopeptide/dipeptide ABC transporter ATP-binding protein